MRLLTTCFTIALFYSPTFSQTTCAPNDPSCSGWFVEDFDVPFGHLAPDIPDNCEVRVQVYYRFCNNSIQIGEWVWVTNDPNNNTGPVYFTSSECEEAFYNHLASFYNPIHSDTHGFAVFHRKFSTQVIDYVGELILKAQLNQIPTIPANSYCFSGLVNAIEYYEGSCQSICVGKVKNKKNAIAIRKGTCGSLCCKMRTLYCIDVSSTPGNVKLVKKGTTFTGDPGTCENPTSHGGIDFECERGIDGEPQIQWLYNLTCEPMCSDQDHSKVFSPNITPIIVDKKIGIQQLNVTIYPNPATDFVNLAFKKLFRGSVRLINFEGKELFSKSVYELNDLQINTSSLGSGMYFLQFKDEFENIITEKINIIK